MVVVAFNCSCVNREETPMQTSTSGGGDMIVVGGGGEGDGYSYVVVVLVCGCDLLYWRCGAQSPKVNLHRTLSF